MATKTTATQAFPDGVTMSDLVKATYAAMPASVQARISPDLVGDLPHFGEALFQYAPDVNAFFYTLINQIALIYVNWRQFDNPLKGLKRGMLEMGDTIEDIYVNPINAIMFKPEVDNKNACDLWKTYKPDITVVYHKKNKAFVYPVTINEIEARKAFQSYGQLDRFVSGIISALYNGDAIDDYLLTRDLLAAYKNINSKDHYYQVHVDAVTNEATGKALVKAIRGMVGKLRYPSRMYNAMGVVNFTPTDDLYLFITPELRASIDVDVLASAFNMDKASFMGHVIEVDMLDGNTQAILADKEFFQIWDSLITMRSTGENPLHLSTNYFYHHQGVFSLSPYYNAVEFTTAAVSEPTAVTVSGSATITRNSTQNYTAAVTGGATQAVVWSVENATASGDPDDIQYVGINQNGQLFVAPEFAGTSVKVIATSVEDPEVSGSTTVTVS